MTDPTQEQRRERFAKLCDDQLGQVPTADGPHDWSGLEDAAEMLHGDEPLPRYVLVTYGGEYPYLYGVDDRPGALAAVLASKCGSYEYGEGPAAVADLDQESDNGEPLMLRVRWETLQFGKRPPASIAGLDLDSLHDALTEAAEYLDDKLAGEDDYSDSDRAAAGEKIERWTRAAEQLRSLAGRRLLVAAFDVTGWTDAEADALAGEVNAQADGKGTDHPNADVLALKVLGV